MMVILRSVFEGVYPGGWFYSGLRPLAVVVLLVKKNYKNK